MPNLEPHPNYGDLMTIDEFKKAVEDGMFIDFDGYGNWATKTEYELPSNVKPSHFYKPVKVAGHNLIDLKPEWATHILWFNR